MCKTEISNSGDKLKLKDVKVFGVHDGSFHADDVFCSAMVKLCNPEARILRTREVIELAYCDLIADVGLGEYDHHQPGRLMRTDLIPYCGWGLMWKDYAEEVIASVLSEKERTSPTGEIAPLDDEIIAYIKDAIDTAFVTFIDAQDNGVRVTKPYNPCNRDVAFVTLAGVVLSFNHMDIIDTPQEVENSSLRDYQFNEALKFGMTFLKESIIYIYNRYIIDTDQLPPTDVYPKSKATPQCYIKVRESFSRKINADVIQGQYSEGDVKKAISYFYPDGKYSKSLPSQLSLNLIRLFTPHTFADEVRERVQDTKVLQSVIPTLDIVFKVLGKEQAQEIYELWLLNEINRCILEYEGSLKIKELVKEAKRDNQHYIVLPVSCPWKKTLLNEDFTENIWYVIYPSENEFKIQCRPVSLFDQTPLHPFPGEWAGLRDAELADVSGVESAVFCHLSRHLCGVRTLEDAIGLVNSLIEG